jgi:hypothetical protein
MRMSEVRGDNLETRGRYSCSETGDFPCASRFKFGISILKKSSEDHDEGEQKSISG